MCNYHLLHNQLSCHTLSTRTLHFQTAGVFPFFPVWHFCLNQYVSIVSLFSILSYCIDDLFTHHLQLFPPFADLYIFSFHYLSKLTSQQYILLPQSCLSALCCASTLIVAELGVVLECEVGAASPDENSQYFISLPARRHRGQCKFK